MDDLNISSDGPLLMNLCGVCPGDELAAECELSPRGEGANKTQHNTNRPLSQCEPTSRHGQPSGRAGSWAEGSVKNRQDNEPPRIVNVVMMRASEINRLTDPIKPVVSTQKQSTESIISVYAGLYTNNRLQKEQL